MYKTDETTRYYHRVYGEILAEKQDMPKAVSSSKTLATSTEMPKAIGGKSGTLASTAVQADMVTGATVVAAATGKIAATKRFKIALQHCATNAPIESTDWVELVVLCDNTLDNDKALSSDDQLGSSVLPNPARGYVRAYFESADGVNAAKVTVTATIVTNGRSVGNGGPFAAGGVNGSFEIVAFLAENGTITRGKYLKITLEHSNDAAADGDWQLLGLVYRHTAPDARNLALNKGDELSRFALPSITKRYVRVCFDSTDETNSLKITVLPVYLAR